MSKRQAEECDHEFGTADGRMHVCKHCGVGRRQPDPWPVTDAAINAVTVLNKSAYISGMRYEQTLHGDSLEMDITTSMGTDPATLKFDHVGPEVYKALVESSMQGRWSLVLMSEHPPTKQEGVALHEDVKRATSLLHRWLSDCLVVLGSGRAPNPDLVSEGPRVIDRGRSAWLRGVFGEASIQLLYELRDTMRRARRELSHLEAARRLMADEEQQNA